MQDQIKNQLQGYINTPSLWLNDLFGLRQFYLPVISTPTQKDLLDNLPELQSNFVLGKRMESFFKYILETSGKYRILAHNLQIRDNKITLGEIDFLAEDTEQEKQLHIEVVFKFYVYDPSFSNELEKWIGPNRKDSLLQKISKLQKQQFPLLFKSPTRNFLQNYNLSPENLIQQVSFKANLFVPRELQDRQFEYINPSCVCGYWIKFEDFQSKGYEDSKYYAPKKLDWPVDASCNEEWYTYVQIKEQILELFEKEKSPLIWRKKSNKEYERFFVVWW